MNLDEFTPLEGALGKQLGSNPGGTYKENKTGKLFYLKFPRGGDDAAKNEVLAAKLYELAGVAVPEVSLITGKDGKLGVASRIEPTFQAVQALKVNVLSRDINWKDKLPDLYDGFAVDAWLANWDVVGLSYDNIGTYVNSEEKTEVYRIDAGGALLYRARGERKGKNFDVGVTEIDNFRSAQLNREAQTIFGKISDEEITQSILKLASIKSDDIQKVVQQHGLGDESEREELAQLLINRRSTLLNSHYINIERLLEKSKLKEVMQVIEAETKTKNPKYEYSPLDKSPETKLFEEIVKDIIEDVFIENKKSDTNGDKAFLENNKNYVNKVFCNRNENDQIFIQRNGELINLINLLENVNFNQISLSKEDIKKYYESFKSDGLFESDDGLFESIGKADLERANLDKLEYGEMAAIRRYTSYWQHAGMQALMRGNIGPYDDPKHIRRNIVHIAVASSGLNKVPSTELPYTIRSQGKGTFDTLLSNVQYNNISQEKAFVSTSTVYQGFGVKMGLKIIYKNVKGKNIRLLSHYPEEEEYLLPPSTQIRWTGYKKVGNRHIFTAEGANNLLYDRHLAPKMEKKFSPEAFTENTKKSLVKSYAQKASKDSILTEKLWNDMFEASFQDIDLPITTEMLKPVEDKLSKILQVQGPLNEENFKNILDTWRVSCLTNNASISSVKTQDAMSNMLSILDVLLKPTDNKSSKTVSTNEVLTDWQKTINESEVDLMIKAPILKGLIDDHKEEYQKLSKTKLPVNEEVSGYYKILQKQQQLTKELKAFESSKTSLIAEAAKRKDIVGFVERAKNIEYKEIRKDFSDNKQKLEEQFPQIVGHHEDILEQKKTFEKNRNDLIVAKRIEKKEAKPSPKGIVR